MSSPFVQSMLAAAETMPPAHKLLDAQRRERLQAFVEHGLPTTRREAWKYTSLRALEQRSFVAVDPDAPVEVDAAQWALPGVDGPRLVFVDGVFRAELSRLDALPAGLRLQPFAAPAEAKQATQDDMLAIYRQEIRRTRDADHAFTNLDLALARSGAILVVEQDAVLTQPIHLVFAGAPASQALAWHTRNMLLVESGARASVVEHHLGWGEQSYLSNAFSDIQVDRGGTLELIVLQQSAAKATLIRHTDCHLGAAATLRLHVLELGGGLVRHDLHARLAGEGARLDTRGVFMLRERQHVDTQLAIHHQAPNTASDSVWRGVADERARGVFRGAIKVAEGADGADAALSNKNLLLSAQAEIDTKPELEIYADEVKAAHGATIGQLDERALFYLRSRGIPLAEARALLTAAFCRAVLQDLPNEALREHLSTLLSERLPADEAA